ncbi:MAG: NusG domain II-containing protein [Lachnospiraceae bacterium]|nr:NusG domain II-containing protein [Lachnospiraceae bacterium]
MSGTDSGSADVTPRKTVRKIKLWKPADIIVILLWISAGFFLMFRAGSDARAASPALRLEVTKDRETVGVYSLDEDRIVEIDGSNTFEIKDGRVRMVSADCPDRVCVHSREISSDGESIVCLPNHVVLKITGGEGGGIDAITE